MLQSRSTHSTVRIKRIKMITGQLIHEGGTVGKDLLAPIVAISAIAGSARTAFKAYTRVPEGHVALRTWKTKARRNPSREGELGKLYGVVGPGGTWMFPYLGGRTIIDTRERRSHLGAMQAINAEEQILMDAAAAWKVSKQDPEHLYRAHYGVAEGDTLEQSVIAVCVGGLQTIASREKRATLLDTKKMTGFLNEECKGYLIDNYGVVLNQVVVREATQTAAQLDYQGRTAMADATRTAAEKSYQGNKAIADAIAGLSPLAQWLNELPTPRFGEGPHLEDVSAAARG